MHRLNFLNDAHLLSEPCDEVSAVLNEVSEGGLVCFAVCDSFPLLLGIGAFNPLFEVVFFELVDLELPDVVGSVCELAEDAVVVAELLHQQLEFVLLYGAVPVVVHVLVSLTQVLVDLRALVVLKPHHLIDQPLEHLVQGQRAPVVYVDLVEQHHGVFLVKWFEVFN